MIGKHTIEIDAKDFIKGVSTSDGIADGGFSPLTYAINPTKTPGVLHAPALESDTGSGVLTAKIIATTTSPYLDHGSIILDDDGAFYTLSGTTLTKKSTTSSDKFTGGTTDFVAWGDDAYSTTFYATTLAGANGNIVKWDSTGGIVSETWWTTVLGQSALASDTPWRPLLVYERHLFVGDGYKLHRISPDNPIVVSNTIFKSAINDRISALGVDKGSGYMMIATTNNQNFSTAKNSDSKIYLYDGFSEKAAKIIPINGVVTAIKNIDDRTIVFVNDKIGYFTGSGIKYLRKMNFSTITSDRLVYSHHAAVNGNTVYYIEDTRLMAYGEVAGSSNKVFYPVYKNEAGGTPNPLDCVFNVDSSKLGIAYTPTSTAKLYTLDLTSTASITSQGARFYTNYFNFPKPVFIRDVRIEWSSTVANTVEPTRMYLFDIIDGLQQFKDLENNTGSTISYKESISLNKKVQSAQFMIQQLINTGIRRILISYDVEN